MSQVTNAPPLPQLILLEDDKAKLAGLVTDPPARIQFQFQPIAFQENLSGNWASQTGLSREHPILQFSHGDQRAFVFEARLYAQHQDQDVLQQLDALKAAVVRDPGLKRPPRWNFVWGSAIDETVVVQSIGNIRYDDLRHDGTVRGISLQLNLLLYREVTIEVAAEAPRGDTFFTATKSGDQWEDIALREYADPLLGELLRRRHPTLPFPGMTPGKVVLLPKLSRLQEEVIEPDSEPLRRTPDGLALRQKMFELRSKTRPSVIVLV